MKNVLEKIKYILIGVVVGVLGYLGIRTFSARYRNAKKELRSLSNELESIGISIGIAEELELGNAGELEQLESTIERERAIIDDTTRKLEDNTGVLESSESRIEECKSIIKECDEILKRYNC